ncbi:hypothetical protein Goari_022291 [Gossypium aridum]|uniref:Uncharacterized protein n=1 Tax=Gossypium aridum TaxID=34290 RepID=A0A7J8YVD9_GOSAI|nr:hypothetical protein [Gossypium aridum]
MLKKARPQPNPPSPPKYVVGKFISKEVEALFLSIQGRMFIFERGFDLSASDCKEVLDLKVDISLRAISDYFGVPHYERDELFDMELEKFHYLCMDAILAYLTNDCGESSEGIEGPQWSEDLSDSSIGGAGEKEKAMEEEKEKEEEDDEVMKDNALEPFHDDFKEAFMPTQACTIGFVIQDPSDRLNYHNLM